MTLATPLRPDDSDPFALPSTADRPATCELGGPQPCPARPELKIADSWGDSAWGCFTHAEEALINLPSVFLASETTTGVAAYRNRRTRAL